MNLSCHQLPLPHPLLALTISNPSIIHPSSPAARIVFILTRRIGGLHPLTLIRLLTEESAFVTTKSVTTLTVSQRCDSLVAVRGGGGGGGGGGGEGGGRGRGYGGRVRHVGRRWCGGVLGRRRGMGWLLVWWMRRRRLLLCSCVDVLHHHTPRAEHRIHCSKTYTVTHNDNHTMNDVRCCRGWRMWMHESVQRLVPSPTPRPTSKNVPICLPSDIITASDTNDQVL
jgi:hypothetical protein